MTNTDTSKRVTLLAKVAVGLSSTLLVVAAVPGLRHHSPLRGQEPARLSASTGRRPIGRVRTGTELIAYFIASSECGASRQPHLPAAMADIRAKLSAQAKHEGKHFIYAAIDTDEDPTTGINFMKAYGPFDEMMAGGSWVGTGSVDYMIRGMPGPLSTPQLLVIERDITAGKSTIRVSPDRIVRRVIGYPEMFKFAGLSAAGT